MQTEVYSGSSRVLWVKLFFVGMVLCVAVSDPGRSAAQTVEPTEIVHIDSDLVDLKISVVRNTLGNQAAALQQKDFLVLEDGEPQEIALFAGENAPLDLVLLLDLSGSTANKLKLIRRSTKRFVEATRPLDRVAIVTFTDLPEVVSPLTSDRARLNKAIGDIEEPLGGTNFWDSLRYVLESALPSQNASRRSAIVVMTDGIDNALPDVFGEGSRTSFDELLDKVGRSGTIVFPIYLDTEKEEVKRHRVPRSAYAIAQSQLERLAEASGTKLYRANELKDLEKVYDQVIGDLGTIYSIGYRPTNTLRDGKWRSVAVQLVDREDLIVRTKRGYYARASQQSK